MTATQKSGSKPAAKANGNKTAPKSKPNMEAVAALNEPAATPLQAEPTTNVEAVEQPAAEFTGPPVQVPLVGALLRNENAAKLVEIATGVGIPLKLDDSGHVITEEQRQGERRQIERDRRQQRQSDAAFAFAVQQLSAPQAPQSEQAPQPIEQPANQGRRAADRADQTDQTDQASSEQPAPATIDPAKQAAFEAQVAALAAAMGMPAPVLGARAPTTPSAGRPHQNGITRPGDETKTGKVWRCADQITAQNKTYASIAELKKHPDLRDFNDHTIRTQYARWRQFNNVSGRVTGATDNQKGNGKQAQAPKFPPMLDEDYVKFVKMSSEGTLPEEYSDWLDQEEQRRVAIRVQREQEVKANIQATTNPQPAPAKPAPVPQVTTQTPFPQQMSDAVFERLDNMWKSNTLPQHWVEPFKALLAERGRTN